MFDKPLQKYQAAFIFHSTTKNVKLVKAPRARETNWKEMGRGKRLQHTGMESFVLHQPSIPLFLHLIKDG